MKSYNIKKLSFCYLVLAILVTTLTGCHASESLDPSGPIARTIGELFRITMALMSLVLIPVFGMTAWFVWKYRASNDQAPYAPDWDRSVWLEWLVWLVPGLIIAILGSMTWIYTHQLDPFRPLESDTPTLEIQVIALDWKWLFIYPKQNIAVVNELSIPINRPVLFKITSNTVMNSFFIPQLGGQIYAMAGMETQLNLLADKPGRYLGENAQFSGRGFPYQNFTVVATTEQNFNAWLEKVRQSPQKLDLRQFDKLAQASIKHPVTYYAAVVPDLFKRVMAKFQEGPVKPKSLNAPGGIKNAR